MFCNYPLWTVDQWTSDPRLNYSFGVVVLPYLHSYLPESADPTTTTKASQGSARREAARQLLSRDQLSYGHKGHYTAPSLESENCSSAVNRELFLV